MQDQDVARRVVAIDGPSGSGKSTVARGVADKLGFDYLDTGAMYRAVTWLALQRWPALEGLADRQDDVSEMLRTAELDLGTAPDARIVRIAGHDVTEVIRGSEVTSAVSVVAALPVVRAHLGALQRRLAADAVAAHGGMVMEGRDIGTAIFPEARLKIWLTATAEARGQRRAAETVPGSDALATPSRDGAGTPAEQTINVDTVVEQLARRDKLDSTRQTSPLQRADDAHVIDTTPYSAQQVIDQVLALWDTIVLPDHETAAGRRVAQVSADHQHTYGAGHDHDLTSGDDLAHEHGDGHERTPRHGHTHDRGEEHPVRDRSDRQDTRTGASG